MIKIANNLQRLVKQANNSTPAWHPEMMDMLGIGEPFPYPPLHEMTHADQGMVDPSAINPQFGIPYGSENGPWNSFTVPPSSSTPVTGSPLRRSLGSLHPRHYNLGKAVMGQQFTPSPDQVQFAQRAMGIPQDQAQFASPEAVKARMNARNQRYTPAPSLMGQTPKPDYRKF